MPDLDPAPRLEAIVVSQTLAGCQTEIGCRLLALVLAGSLARHEGSWLPAPEPAAGLEPRHPGPAMAAVRLLGDAELLMILPSRARLPSPAQLHRLQSRIEGRLRAHGIEAQVSLTPVRQPYLRNLPPHIFGYELRQTGRVLWGDRRILDLVPPMERAQLPRADAWRLLANRIIELLPAAWAQRHRQPASPEEIYPWVKLHLDMATSLLLFLNAYAPTYRERARRLRLMAAEIPLRPDWIGQVEACTEWKLHPHAEIQRLFPAPHWQAEAIAAVRALWRWELQQLTGCPPAASDAQLWQHWMRQQSWASRLRGWASAARRNLQAAGRLWPRWLVMAGHASPRHWVYRAGSELLFHGFLPDPSRLDPGAPPPPRLPLSRNADLRPDQRVEETVAQVGKNYRLLVQSTRA